jgi:hypothetical protein
MGTRSFVGVMKGSKCHAVYVHWDGYLSGVGAELQGYTTQAEVEELIAGGDMSTLEDYYKDRGDTGTEPKVFDTFAEFLEYAEDCWAEYYYIFRDGVWYCGDTYGKFGDPTSISKKLVPYAEAVELEEQAREAEEENSY